MPLAFGDKFDGEEGKVASPNDVIFSASFAAAAHNRNFRALWWLEIQVVAAILGDLPGNKFGFAKLGHVTGRSRKKAQKAQKELIAA